MFSRSISELKPWTDQGMFDRVSGQGYRDGYGSTDVTMTAVAKALLTRRLKDEETFEIKISNIPHDCVPDDMAEAINNIVIAASGVHDARDVSNMLIISQARNMSAGDFDSAKTAIEAQFLPANPAWKIHAKAEAFLGKEINTRVLFNESTNSAIVMVNKLSTPLWHLLGSMLPAYVKGLFDSSPLTEDEKAVLKALALHGSEKFISAMSILEDNYDIRGQRIRSLIAGFEMREREHQVNLIDNEIEQLISQMNDLMRRYSECVEKKDNANIRRAGLKYIIDQGSDEDHLVEFFSANKCLDVVNVRGTCVSFIVRTYYENFDTDEYEHFRENHSFFEEMVPERGAICTEENARKILDAMFITGKLRLKICALYHLDIRGDVSTTCGYEFPPNCSDYIPNYHLDHHRCFGNYEGIILGYLNNGDTIGAINACIASAKSVNIAESGATFNPMMREVFATSKACFELPDGTSVTPAKALEWLNEQEG